MKMKFPCFALGGLVAACVVGACAQPDPVYITVQAPTPTPAPIPRPRVIVEASKPAPQDSPESFEAVTRPQSYSE